MHEINTKMDTSKYHIFLRDNLKCSTSLYSISQYNPYDWIKDHRPIYRDEILKCIYEEKENPINVNRITVCDKEDIDNRIIKDFLPFKEANFSKIAIQYLTNEEIEEKKERITNSLSKIAAEIRLEILAAFSTIHSSTKESIMLSKAGRHYLKDLAYLHENDEMLIYDKFAFIVGKEENEENQQLYNVKFKIEKADEIEQLKRIWNEVKYNTLEKGYSQTISYLLEEVNLSALRKKFNEEWSLYLLDSKKREIIQLARHVSEVLHGDLKKEPTINTKEFDEVVKCIEHNIDNIQEYFMDLEKLLNNIKISDLDNKNIYIDRLKDIIKIYE